MTAFGLYVHWPFCEAKCPYCDFNSHVTASVDQARWGRALAAEIARARSETGPRELASIFFGGGTPSLMMPETVATVIDAASAAWGFAPDIEITLEANPTSTERDRFAGFAAAGVNRVSLGVQSLKDADLRRLGRRHSADEAVRAVEIARSSFSRVSFDLIYARQDQTVADWSAELTQALQLAPDHLSLYQLTIEPGTAFYDRRQMGGLKGLPDEDVGADLWEVTQDICAAHGLPPYEISNHARPGSQSRHNLIYWRNQDWVGVGPGAHGRFMRGNRRVATETHLVPGKWLAAVEDDGSGESACADLNPVEIASDALMMGLRLMEGLELNRVHAIQTDEFMHELNDLGRSGFITVDAGQLRLTDAGRPVLNAILRRLLPA